jgi:hypothetical protein
MKARRRLPGLLLLAALLALAWTAGATAGTFTSERERAGKSALPGETGQIRMEGVSIRGDRWISIGETGFHPDQTLLPGGPDRRIQPKHSPAAPARAARRR